VASAIFVYGEDATRASVLASRLASAIPEVRALAWTEDAPFLRASVGASIALHRISRGMVFAAVLIPVMALLYVFTVQRRRQVALLLAMGFTRGDVFLTSLFQSLVVSVLGAAGGALLGFLVVRYFQAHPIFVWHSFVVRPLLSAAVLSGTTVLVLVAAIAGGLFPAWQAARTDPGSILREGE
jgi:ABC-type lipoprotein release transport system permease subunit